MATVKCEYCSFEQDLEKSRICDNCGRRLTRTREEEAKPAPAKVEAEAKRCPNCGISTTKPICSSCGAMVKAREV